jgi:hypothetical protein
MKVEVEKNKRTKRRSEKSNVLQEEGQWDSEGNLGLVLATSGPGRHRHQLAAEA